MDTLVQTGKTEALQLIAGGPSHMLSRDRRRFLLDQRRRVSLSIAWSREDARFSFEVGGAMLTRRFSSCLLTRVTPAARRVYLST
jgi:hypothetical protein